MSTSFRSLSHIEHFRVISVIVWTSDKINIKKKKNQDWNRTGNTEFHSPAPVRSTTFRSSSEALYTFRGRTNSLLLISLIQEFYGAEIFPHPAQDFQTEKTKVNKKFYSYWFPHCIIRHMKGYSREVWMQNFTHSSFNGETPKKKWWCEKFSPWAANLNSPLWWIDWKKVCNWFARVIAQ